MLTQCSPTEMDFGRAGGRRVVVRRGFDRELLVETIGVLEGLS